MSMSSPPVCILASATTGAASPWPQQWEKPWLSTALAMPGSVCRIPSRPADLVLCIICSVFIWLRGWHGIVCSIPYRKRRRGNGRLVHLPENSTMNKFLPLARRIALGGIALTVALTAGAQPAAPVQQNVSQVPGYYRQPVGEFMVTAVYDGFVDLDTTLLKGMRAEDMQKLFARMFVQHENGVQTAVNAFLVQGKGRLVLVDAGAAACFGPTMGSLMMNIRAAGFAPEEVDDVLLTHLHPDHACGLATKD